MPARRRGAAVARPRLRRAAAALPAARAGSSTTRRRSGRACSRAAEQALGSRAAARSRAIGDHEPARDDAALGSQRAAGRCTARSSGRTGGPPSAARSCPPSSSASARGSSPIRTSRRRSSSGSSASTGDRSPSGRSTRWLVWKLTGGARACDRRDERLAHAALRARDARLGRRAARALRRAARVLPEIVPSSGHVGEAELLGPHAADRRHRRRPAGSALRQLSGPGAKATYGTGSLRPRRAAPTSPRRDGVLRTAAARLGTSSRAVALEGAVFVTGAALQWLRDALGLLADAAESEALARSLDRQRRRLLRAGPCRARLTALGPGRARARSAGSRAARGASTSSAPPSKQPPSRPPTSSTRCRRLPLLRADGGMTQNRWLMQFQADMLGIPVEAAREPEQTAPRCRVSSRSDERRHVAGRRALRAAGLGRSLTAGATPCAALFPSSHDALPGATAQAAPVGAARRG